MINRVGNTNDDLGMYEPMRDEAEDTKGYNISATFWLYFTNNTEEVY